MNESDREREEREARAKWEAYVKGLEQCDDMVVVRSGKTVRIIPKAMLLDSKEPA